MSYRFFFIIIFTLIFTFEGNAWDIREPLLFKDVHKESGKSTYTLFAYRCVILLQLSEIDKKSFSIRDITESPSLRGPTSSCLYERRMQLTDKVLARIAKDTDNLKRVKSFYAENLGAEPMYRLASAAAQSPEWDRERGCPKGRGKKLGTEDLVKTYIRKNNVFKELSDLFGKYHLKLKVEDVEEVHILQVKTSHIVDYAKRPGSKISPEDKLPMSASILFLIEPE